MLEIVNLFYRYGKIDAINDVSFKVNRGEIVTLIGRNGGGKSTLLKAISGIVKPCGGDIYFEGKRINGLRSCNIARLGISHIPEGRGIFPNLTVIDNLMMGAYLRSDKKGINDDAKRIFETFPILKRRRLQIGASLSGGEAQMLAIGRGLMSRPKCILFDEPSMGLSPLLVTETFRIIKRINEDGMTIVVVSENVTESLEISNRAHLMEMGRVVLSGTGSELLQNEDIKNIYLGINT